MLESKLEITNLLTPLINSFKLLSDEWNNLMDIGLTSYLHSQTEKYYFTNTFIHRNEKVLFDSIYYPLKAHYNHFVTDFSNIDDIFKEYKNITIRGSAGSGKSTLIKYIFLNSIKEKFKVPVLIELRYLNDYNGDFEKLISEKILKTDIKPSQDILKRALKSGRFLFLLDGYDEIFSEKKQELNRQIELFVDSYSDNNFLITTRPGSGIENFSRFRDFNMNPLDDEGVKGFIEKIVSSEERKNRIVNVIEDPKNNTYLDYLRNPLLLSMFILAFESHPEIPSRKSSFYRNVFDTLYSKHDGITKNSFPRQKLTNFEREDFEKILMGFSYASIVQGKYSFTTEFLTDTLNKVLKSININTNTENLIYDLQTTISILILDGFEYFFPHRSMQEYFTAQFLNSVPSEKKSKAYSNMVEVLESSSADQSFHLWDLCNEIDRFSFLSHFIIPFLELNLKKINKKNDLDSLNSFIEILEPTINNDIHETSNIVIYRLYNFNCRLIEYYSVYEYDKFAFFIEQSGMKPEFLEYIKKKYGDNFNFHDIILDNSIKRMLIKYGIMNVINEYKNLISKQISTLKSELESEKKNIDSLLNF